MQDRHGSGRDLAEFVMLSPAFQTLWVMENLHDKFTLFQTQTLLHLIQREQERNNRNYAGNTANQLSAEEKQRRLNEMMNAGDQYEKNKKKQLQGMEELEQKKQRLEDLERQKMHDIKKKSPPSSYQSGNL